MKGLTRREAVVGILATAAACASLPRYRVTQLPIRVPLSEIGPKGRVILEYPSLPYPILLSTAEDGDTAVRMECTHKGCPLTARRTKLVCDCHGSEFADDGAVLKGPADVDLVTYPTHRENDEIVVEI